MSKSNIIPFNGNHQANARPPTNHDLSSVLVTLSEACHIDQSWRSKGYSNIADFIRDAVLSFAGLPTKVKGSNPSTNERELYVFGWKIWRKLNFSTEERRRIQAAARLSTRKQPEVMEFVWWCLERFYDGMTFLEDPNWRQTLFSEGRMTVERARKIVFLQVVNLEQRKEAV
jgi:hypothetical protein